MSIIVPFTNESLAAVQPPSVGRVYVRDTMTPHLCFCKTDKSGASFYIYRKLDRKPRYIRLGGFPEISVEVARAAAAKVNSEIATGTYVKKPRSRCGRRGWIYLALDARGLCKIGFTLRCVNKRLASLTTNAAIDWVSIKKIQVLNATVAEKAIQKRYAAQRFRHEWFRLTEAQMQDAIEWCARSFSAPPQTAVA